MIAAGLPLGLVDDSVRVTARGATALTATVILEAPGADEHLPEAIPAVLRDARRASAIADGEVERIRREIEAIEAVSLVSEASPEQPPVAWLAVTAARRALMEMRQTRVRELRQSLITASAHAQECLRTLRAVTDANQRRSDARSPRAQELRKSIAIELVHGDAAASAGSDDAGADDIELIIEYAVRGARWAPSYVARYQAGQIHWTIRAQLAQQTGEDWTGVALRLSTAALDGHSELPELAALKIGKRQESVARRLRPPPPGVDELYADFDRDLRHKEGGERTVITAIGQARIGAADSRSVQVSPAYRREMQDAYDEEDALVLAKKSGKRQRASAPSSPPPPPQAAMKVTAYAMSSEVTLGAAADEGPPRGGGGGGGREEMARTMVAGYAQNAPARPEPLPPEPRALFDYTGLVMAASGDPRRGQLVAMSLVERYHAPSGVDADEVSRRLAHALYLANKVDEASLPAGTSTAWSHDFDYALDAEGRIDVPSDGSWHSVPVLSRSAPATIAHVAVPREATEIFRTARSENPFDAPILPGPVDVYDGDRFLITAAAPVAAPGGELILPLGVDASIKLARNCDFREEVTGMLRGSLRLHHELRLEVQNTSPAAIELEVRERVPVPRQRDSDDITVEVGAVQPAWEAWTPPPSTPGQPLLRGGYRWKLKVAPRTTAKLSAAYEVRIAGKHELSGGNRRES